MSYPRELLQAAVDSATRDYNTYPSSYRQIREGFEVGGTLNKSGLISAIASQTHESESSVRRQVNRYEMFLSGGSGQARNPDRATGKYKAAFQEIGRTQEPTRRDAPPGGLTFKVDMRVPRDSEHSSARTRQATITMDYATAAKFVQNPTYNDLFEEWFEGGADTYGEDGDYVIDVYGVSAA